MKLPHLPALARQPEPAAAVGAATLEPSDPPQDFVSPSSSFEHDRSPNHTPGPTHVPMCVPAPQLTRERSEHSPVVKSSVVQSLDLERAVLVAPPTASRAGRWVEEGEGLHRLRQPIAHLELEPHDTNWTSETPLYIALVLTDGDEVLQG